VPHNPAVTKPRTIISADEYRQAFEAGAAPEDVMIRTQFIPDEVKAAGDSRQISFVISTAAVDRQGDTISVAGWRLENFLKNPVVLFAHRYDQLPVARAISVSMTPTALKAVAEFPAKGLYALADTVYEMLKGGFLRATSVGFRPVKSARNEERPGYALDFIEQELLEFSVVPVPCNPEALMESAKGLQSALAAGIDLSPLEEAFRFAKAFVPAEIPRDEKAGRRFSKANAKLIKDAHECSASAIKHLKALIDQLEDDAEEPEDEPEPEPEKAVVPPLVPAPETPNDETTYSDMAASFGAVLTKVLNAGSAGKE
jgi:HK97 family phage prohead protease